MPVYVYYCPHRGCKRTIEVSHSMSECDRPSKQLTEQTTCEKHNIRMQRQIFEPQLMGASEGQFKSEKELLKEKQTQRKLRARLHFKNEELDKVSDADSRKHFKKKYATDPILKNLKGDHAKEKKKYN